MHISVQLFLPLSSSVPRPRVWRSLRRPSRAHCGEPRLSRGKKKTPLPCGSLDVAAPLVKVFYNADCGSFPQMGYGSRTLELLQMYYEGKFPTMTENGHAGNSEITTVGSEVSQPETHEDDLRAPEMGVHFRGRGCVSNSWG